jgi:hypothetical protein
MHQQQIQLGCSKTDKMEQPSLADIIAKVGAVMKKAASMKVAAKLVQLTSGRSVFPYPTSIACPG